MCVALAALDATVHVTGPTGERAIAFADFHRLPGDTPQRDTNLQRRRDHHGGRAAGAGLRRELHLSEDPRPPVLRVRAGVGRRGAGAGRRHDQGGATRARRRRAQAVAERRRRSSAARASWRTTTTFARAADIAAARRQGLRAQHLQDRPGAPRHRPRADAGGAGTPQSQSNKKIVSEPWRATSAAAPSCKAPCARGTWVGWHRQRVHGWRNRGATGHQASKP